MSAEAAVAAVRSRAARQREASERRWEAAVGTATGDSLDEWANRVRNAGRLTLNFHPDRVGREGHSVAAGLLKSGRYESQWVTGLSAGSRSAVPGGERHRWERLLFDGAYDEADPTLTPFPVYGSFDLLLDPHGGSPRFGSSFVVLRRQVLERTTICVGDSHVGPKDVGTITEAGSVLAGLAEQASRDELLNRGVGVDAFLRACGGSYQSPQPSRDLDGYIEAQVHGGVALESDVEAIVLDPSFRGTSVEEDLSAASDRYDFLLRWHGGSEIHADDVPDDFRGPTMPILARQVARADGFVDADRIGRAVTTLEFGEPTITGDPPESKLQQLKYLWHTVLAHGTDVASVD
jgi:hypothetical protein